MPRAPGSWLPVVVVWLMALAAELTILARVGVFRGRATSGSGGLVGMAFSLWQLLALIGVPLAALAISWLWLRDRGP